MANRLNPANARIASAQCRLGRRRAAKRINRHRYDLSVWIECSFETALKRAVARAQESLPPVDTIRAYETIVLPWATAALSGRRAAAGGGPASTQRTRLRSSDIDSGLACAS